MILEIKDFISPDINKVWEWYPESIEDVYFLLELDIGYKDNATSDIFQITITSPEALRIREKVLSSCFSGQRYLIVLSYNWDIIEQELSRIVKDCSCNTWEESVGKLTKYFLWEYKDHEYSNK